MAFSLVTHSQLNLSFLLYSLSNPILSLSLNSKTTILCSLFKSVTWKQWAKNFQAPPHHCCRSSLKVTIRCFQHKPWCSSAMEERDAFVFLFGFGFEFEFRFVCQTSKECLSKTHNLCNHHRQWITLEIPPLATDLSPPPLLVRVLVGLGICFSLGDKGFGDFLFGFERWGLGMVICESVGIFCFGFCLKIVLIWCFCWHMNGYGYVYMLCDQGFLGILGFIWLSVYVCIIILNRTHNSEILAWT